MKLKIFQYNESFEPEVLNLVQKDSYSRLRKDKNFNQKLVTRFQEKQTRSLLSNRSSNVKCICLAKGDQILGFAILKKSKWDSKIFNINVWHLESLVNLQNNIPTQNEGNVLLLNEIRKICLEEKINIVVTRIDTENISLIQAMLKSGYRFMETIIWMSRPLNSVVENFGKSASIDIRFAMPNDIETIINKIDMLFIKSRFYKEDIFDRKKVNELYKKWIEDSFVENEIWIHIAEIENKLAGFWINKMQYKTEDFGINLVVGRLTAVFPDFRGRGVMKNLAIHSINHFGNNDTFLDGSAVVDNFASINTLISLGFRCVYSFHTFHLVP